MSQDSYDQASAIALLNEILETELAGVVRYTHYSLMIFGHSRIPIVSWLRTEAETCLAHATQAGELVTQLGDHPSLKLISTASTTSCSNLLKPRRPALISTSSCL